MIWLWGVALSSANPRKPQTISNPMPQTRWWMCRPPDVLTLPGHQLTFGLRISRELVRMNSHDPRKPARTHSAIDRPLGTLEARIAQVVGRPAMPWRS